MWIFRIVNFVGFQIRCNRFGLHFEKGVSTVQNYDFFVIEFIFLSWCNRPCRYCVIILWQEIPPSQRYSKRGFSNRVSCLCDLRYLLLLCEHVTDMRKNVLRWGDFARCLKHKCNRRVPDIMSFIEWITDLKMTLEWYWILFIFNVCGWFSCDLSEQCDRG